MSDKPLFEGMDEQERAFAPQQLPAEQRERVAADDGALPPDPAVPPAAAPVAGIASNASGAAAPAGVRDDATRADDRRDQPDFFGQPPLDDEERADRPPQTGG